MRNTNRKRALVVSSAVILLCMSIILGTTWALFTDTQTVTNHLQAGDLKIGLDRTYLEKTTLDDKGFFVVEADDDRKDFKNPSDENVFALADDEVIVPGSKFEATMEITNEGNVAFGYWIGIICTDQTKAEDLAQQLTVKVYADTNGDGKIDEHDEHKSKVGSGLTVGGPDDKVGVLGIKESATFMVSVEFDDLGYEYKDGKLRSKNDAAKTESIDFDLVVYALQETDAPAISTP